MRRFRLRYWATAAGLALVLAPLAAWADIDCYVNPLGPNGNSAFAKDDTLFTGNGTYSDTTKTGYSPAHPWATPQFAMKMLAQPNTANGNVTLHFGNGAPPAPILSYNAGNAGLNPRRGALNGKRYFIYGNLGDSTLVRIDSTSFTKMLRLGAWAGDMSTVASIPIANCISYRGMTFWDAVLVTDGNQVWQRDTSSAIGFTRERLFDSLSSCVIGNPNLVVTPQTGNPAALKVFASDVAFQNVRISGPPGGGGSNTPAQFAINNEPPTSTTPPNVLLNRRRAANVHFYNLNYDFGAYGQNTFWAGKEVDSNNQPVPKDCQSVDSMRFWFSTINLNPALSSQNKAMSFFNTTHLSLRGNHWIENVVECTQTNFQAFSIRDSCDGLTIDRDTVLVYSDATLAPKIRLWWYENSSRAAGKPNGIIRAVVDSSYFSAYQQEFQGNFMAGTWTYNTFVTSGGLDTDNGNVTQWDSTATTTFDHNTFLGVGNTSYGRVVDFSGIAINSNYSGWPVTVNDGSVCKFTNNLIFRRALSPTNPTCWSSRNDVMRWGWAGTNPPFDAPKKIQTDWNLYSFYNQIGAEGDLAVAWETKDDFNAAPCQSSRRSSRIGHDADGTHPTWSSKAYLWNHSADSSVAGTSAELNPADYDSASVYCRPGEVLFEQWGRDSALYDSAFVYGRILRLKPGAASPAKSAGYLGTDIGAVSTGGSSVSFPDEPVCLGCGVHQVPLGGGTITANGVDSLAAGTYISVTLSNDGTEDLVGAWSTEPQGSYYFAADSSVNIAPGRTRTYVINLYDPENELGYGTYGVYLVLTTNEPGVVPRRWRYDIIKTQY